jgi:dTMP kinase
MMSGFFCNFEGADGSGKTTVLELIKKELSDLDIVTTKEPQGIFRDLVLDPENKVGLTEVARMFLYQADRSIHTEKVVKPNLDNGKIVISDRGIMSTLVYQEITTRLSVETLFEIAEVANDGVFPDLIILFDMNYETAKKRMDSRELDYFDSKGKDFYDKLVYNYQAVANWLREEQDMDIVIIDATKPLDVVVKEVCNFIRVNNVKMNHGKIPNMLKGLPFTIKFR